MTDMATEPKAIEIAPIPDDLLLVTKKVEGTFKERIGTLKLLMDKVKDSKGQVLLQFESSNPFATNLPVTWSSPEIPKSSATPSLNKSGVPDKYIIEILGPKKMLDLIISLNKENTRKSWFSFSFGSSKQEEKDMLKHSSAFFGIKSTKLPEKESGTKETAPTALAPRGEGQ